MTKITFYHINYLTFNSFELFLLYYNQEYFKGKVVISNNIIILSSFGMILVVAGCQNNTPEIDMLVLTGEYVGQTVPGDSVELFGNGIISTGGSERDASFSPDGKEFYYSYVAPTNAHSVIMTTKMVEGVWTSPEVASFSGIHSDLEPFISPDGNSLYFASKRPLDGIGDEKDWDIWVVERIVNDWSEPINIGSPINTDGDEFYPSVTTDRTIYWTGEYEGGFGTEDIYRSKYYAGEYMEPENLGASVNSEKFDFNAFISPNEDYLLFSSFRRADTFGGGDIYLSKRNDDGSWSQAKNLGEKINSAGLDYCPLITPDGKYLLFSSNRRADMSSSDKKRSYKEINDMYNSAQNGLGDIYWVSSDVLALP